jgi:hypothetical protein
MECAVDLSHGGYHSVGAAKIVAPIGKTFTEAMKELCKSSD